MVDCAGGLVLITGGTPDGRGGGIPGNDQRRLGQRINSGLGDCHPLGGLDGCHPLGGLCAAFGRRNTLGINVVC